MRTVEEIAHMAIAGEVDPRPARAHAVSRLALRHRVEGAGRTPLVCAAFHCAARPAAASEAIHARVRAPVLHGAVVRTALVTVGCVGVQGLRIERRACVVAKGEAEATWSRRYARRSLARLANTTPCFTADTVRAGPSDLPLFRGSSNWNLARNSSGDYIASTALRWLTSGRRSWSGCLRS